MLNGALVNARVSRIVLRAASAFIAPTPSEPRPPAFETAAASAGVLTPAIGAWMIGLLMPSRLNSDVLSERVLMSGPHRNGWRARAPCARARSQCYLQIRSSFAVNDGSTV